MNILSVLHSSDTHEKQARELNTQLKDTQKAKEATLREVNELKTQLKMVEESRDSVRRDLIEAHRKIREGELNLFVNKKYKRQYLDLSMKTETGNCKIKGSSSSAVQPCLLCILAKLLTH